MQKLPSLVTASLIFFGIKIIPTSGYRSISITENCSETLDIKPIIKNYIDLLLTGHKNKSSASLLT